MKSIILLSDDPGVGGVAQYNYALLSRLYGCSYQVYYVVTSKKALENFNGTTTHSNIKCTKVTTDQEFYSLLLHASPAIVLFSNSNPFANLNFVHVVFNIKLPYIIVEGLVESYLAHINSSYLSILTQHYQNAKAVIAVSQDNLQSLHQYFGLPPHQGQVIHYGRPPAFFTPIDFNIRHRIRQDLNIPLKATLCLTTARLEERKGYQYQIEAIRHLIHTPAWDNLYFLWVGGSIFAPQFEAWIRHEINTLGIQDRIIILDQRSDIADLLNAADIFVLPSRAEGMPLSIMEAMAKGLPVIATAISGIPEELGDSGYLLPDPNLNPQATIQRLIEILQDWTLNPHKTAQIAEEGHRRAQHHFQEQRMTDQTLAVIEQALLQPQDYISSNLKGIDLAAAFPHRVQGDPSTCQWPYLRREIPHPWYVDQRQPIIGFLSPDEAHILYNNALQFKGRSALEIGCWLGWSACHLAAAGVKLDVVDPLLQQPGIYQSVVNSLALAGVAETVNLVPGSSPDAIEMLGTKGKRQWSLIFIDGNHEDDGPLQDAIVCEKFAATDALIMFHDLAAPAVAKGLDYYRQKGWKTLVYQTMQIMGVAWRGNVQPVLHQPDPRVHWVLPPHLQHYPVSHLGLDLTQHFKTSIPPLTKVTFCTCDSPNFSGGPNSFLRELLPTLQAKGITVEILIFVAAIPQACPCFAALDRAGIPCKTFPWQTTTEQKIRWILSQLTESQPDVFVPNMLVSAFYASRWVKASGIPTVGILHSDDDFHHQVLQDFVLGDPSYRFSAIVPVSQKLHSMVQEALQSQPSSSSYSLDPVVTACIPCGASLPNETAQVPQKTLRLIYTGRLEIEQKQILKLTQALCQVVNIVPGVEALIVGEGSARAEIQEILQKDPNLPVHLVGFVDQEQVKNYLLQSHVFVLLSDYEGLPVSLIEAMACGLVPVCLDIRSGIPELVEDGVTGLLVHDREKSFVQAIQTLKTDMELWSTLSRSARAKIECNYSSQVSTDRWLELLQDLHQHHPRQNPIPPPLEVPTLIDLPPVRPVFLREDFRQDILLTPPYQKTDQSVYHLQGLPTKVLVIDAVFFQLYQTGIARVWRSILNQWANTEFGKHIVILDRGQTAPQIPGLRYRTIPPFSYQNLEGDRQLLQQICDEENADLLISTYYTTPLTTPTVFMGYDMIPEVMQSLGAPVDLNDPMWVAKHHAINHASHYLTISENTAQDLQQFFPNIAPEQITVAHCGVSPTFTPPSAAEIAQFKHKYGITKPYFLTIGSGAGGYKNLILFYQAIAQLPTRHGFDIVATGVYLQVDPQFRDLAQGITIHTLNLSDEELRLAYGGAIALVYPSSYEGFGMPIAEAMACGCPVITCPNASIPEVAGEAALYVFDQDIDGMAEALCEVQKPTVRNSLIPAGLEQVRQFSWVTMATTVADTLIATTLAPLNLCHHTLIAFPDWTQPEEELQASLTAALRQAVHYADSLETDPETLQITLLIDIAQAPDLDLDALMASAALELMLNEELEVPDGIQITPLPPLSPLQWQHLRPRLTARILLVPEAIDRAQTHCPNLPADPLTANNRGNPGGIAPTQIGKSAQVQ